MNRVGEGTYGIVCECFFTMTQNGNEIDYRQIIYVVCRQYCVSSHCYSMITSSQYVSLYSNPGVCCFHVSLKFNLNVHRVNVHLDLHRFPRILVILVFDLVEIFLRP